MPWSTASAGEAQRTSWPSIVSVPASCGAKPARVRVSSSRPGADHAGDAQDLAGMQLEADVAVGAAQAQTLGLEQDLVAKRALQRLAVVLGLQAAADHQPVQPVHVGLGRRQLGDDGAVLHDVDAVAQLQHLVEAVRDEDERGARLQRADALEQDVDVGALQHRGRLVEQDDEMALRLLLERQRLGQLDHLAGGEAEVGRAQARVRSSSPTLASWRRAAAYSSPQRTRPARVKRASLPSQMFSPTERLVSSDCSWNTMPMPCRAASVALRRVTGSPPSRIRPASGW